MYWSRLVAGFLGLKAVFFRQTFRGIYFSDVFFTCQVQVYVCPGVGLVGLLARRYNRTNFWA